MRRCVYIAALIFSAACSGPQYPSVDILVGEWQREGKPLYEVWEKDKAGGLTGYGYRLQNGERQILETLVITVSEDSVIFTATVPDQNDGKAVLFVLNKQLTDMLSFENPQHDFPKKIQYRPLSDDRIEVSVLGDPGQGFSFVQVRQ